MLDFGFYNMDCMEGMKEFPDKYFELAIVDPPYREAKNNAPTKDMRKKTTNGNMKSFGEKPNSQYFNELFRVSQNQIVWGGNNFIDNLYSTNCFLFWYKQNPMPNYSDGEMAWTSFQTVARCILLPYYGTLNSDFKKIHPTQKPVALYEWLLYNYAKQGDKILDTHVGSASSLIACYNLGFDYVGFELDKDYYDAASKRIDENKAQIRFDANMEMF